MFTITLSDGTQLTNLELNGNNFISDTEVTETTFAGKLGRVAIAGNPEDDAFRLIGNHEHMKLVQITKYEDKWWFILRKLSKRELEDLRTDASLSYLEMITEGE